MKTATYSQFRNVVLVTILAVIFAMPAHSCLGEGTNKIDGAFGLKLGDKFDLSKSIGRATNNGVETLYEFKPKSPYPYFSKYYVEITPKTSLIHSIITLGPKGDIEKAEHEMEIVFKALTEKYGAGDGGGQERYIIQDRRGVILKLEIIQRCLSLAYVDNDLTKQAQSERSELEEKRRNEWIERDSKGRDKSGL